MITLLVLYYEFFVTGLFAVGGGLTALPFLYAMVDKYDWFSMAEVINMIAISESTPGPLGINMATFAGYHASGVVGSIVATFAIMTPSLLLISILAKMLEKFKSNKYVVYVFYGLRAAVGGLLLKAFYDVASVTFIMEGKTLNLVGLIVFVIILFLIKKFRWHPIIYISLSAVLGFIINYLLILI